MKLFSFHKSLLAVFIGMLGLRLLLVNVAYHIDMYSFYEWAHAMYKDGLLGIYNHEGFLYSSPTQPPIANLLWWLNFYLYQFLVWLFSMMAYFIAIYRLAPSHVLWWFDFVKWFGDATVPVSDMRMGGLVTLKLFPILADLIMGGLVYYVATLSRRKQPILWSLLYLIIPFNWYLSSLWGQYDQVGVLAVFVAFLALYKRWFILSTLLFFIACGIKPTSLIFMPLFGYFYLQNKPKVLTILVSIIMVGITLYITTAPFTDGNLSQFMLHDLLRFIFQKAEYRVVTNAYNFWHIIVGDTPVNHEQQYLFISAKYWSYLFLLIINLLAFKTIKVRNLKSLFTSLFIVGAGSWLFLTNMLERYYLAGVVSLFFMVLTNPTLLRLWLVVSLTYLINLYVSWGVPQSLGFIKTLFSYQNGMVGSIVSVINLVIFFQVLSLEKVITLPTFGTLRYKVNLKVLKNYV